jgi:isopenicillin-N N-acyltransferase-like protein
MSGVPKVVLEGSDYERGVTHGEAFSGEIRENVDLYLQRLARNGAPEEVVRERVPTFIDIIEDESLEIYDGMRGIADGADVAFEDVAILNTRSELMYSAFAEDIQREADEDDLVPETDGCTSFGLTPEATADGHTYIGQNWDWIPELEHNIFLMDIRREDKPNMLAVTEAGIVAGRMGVNEHGIGQVGNGLISERDGENPYRKPHYVRTREVFNASRFPKAIEPILKNQVATSRNYLVGHGGNGAQEIIDFEVAPHQVNYLYPEDGVLTHTNHFKDTTGVESKFERRNPDSLPRLLRGERLLAKRTPHVTVSDMKRMLRDEVNRPDSICAYVDEDLSEHDQTQTNMSIIVDLTDRKVYIAEGPPAESKYYEYSVATTE